MKKAAVILFALALVFSPTNSFAQRGTDGSDGKPSYEDTAKQTYKDTSGDSHGSAGAAQMVTQIAGTVGIAAGSAMAAAGCPTAWTATLCIAGIGTGVVGIGAMVYSMMSMDDQKNKTKPTGLGNGPCAGIAGVNPDCSVITDPGTQPPGGTGDPNNPDYRFPRDPNNPNDPNNPFGPGAGGPSPGPSSPPSLSDMSPAEYQRRLSLLPPNIKDQIKKLEGFAKGKGMDITTPKGLQNAMDQAKAGGGGGSGGDMFKGLSPQAAEALKNELKAIQAKYGTSDVGLDGGGGARMPGGTAGDNMDLAALMKGMMPEQKPGGDRGPASEGLSKSFNGEPVGLASDDLFKMVTRRYKAKEQTKQFLGTTPSSVKRF